MITDHEDKIQAIINAPGSKRVWLYCLKTQPGNFGVPVIKQLTRRLCIYHLASVFFASIIILRVSWFLCFANTEHWTKRRVHPQSRQWMPRCPCTTLCTLLHVLGGGNLGNCQFGRLRRTHMSVKSCRRLHCAWDVIRPVRNSARGRVCTRCSSPFAKSLQYFPCRKNYKNVGGSSNPF